MKVIIICGATCTGKSELALHLAQKLNCEIINYDSVQVYKEFDTGTAKPTKETLSKVPHHLIDYVEPTAKFTAGDFRRHALQILAHQSQNKKYGLLVGGTGFYLNALLNGMFEVPPVKDSVKHKLKKELEDFGIEKLYDELKMRDSPWALKIHKNDTYRILRALEILRSQKKTLTQIKKEFVPQKFPHSTVKIGLRREKSVLKESIRLRTIEMIEDGLVTEVRGLLLKYGENLGPLTSVGYKETVSFLKGDISTVEELIEKIIESTVHLAKRQSTWFKRDSEIHWFDPDKGNILEQVFNQCLF